MFIKQNWTKRSATTRRRFDSAQTRPVPTCAGVSFTPEGLSSTKRSPTSARLSTSTRRTRTPTMQGALSGVWWARMTKQSTISARPSASTRRTATPTRNVHEPGSRRVARSWSLPQIQIRGYAIQWSRPSTGSLWDSRALATIISAGRWVPSRDEGAVLI